uniref:HTH CENPB-type domain-containing protein n=1 Tax=Latimeria chalumnae TaxID=7897 RepID=H3A682_LATCH
RSSHDAGFKLQVVEYAEQSNNSATGCEFGITEKMVRDWRKMEETLKEMLKIKHAHCGALEVDLHEWVLQSWQNGYIATKNTIRLRALKMTKEEKYKADAGSTFVASAGWCTCFMERHGLTMQQQTKVVQKLPKDLEMKVVFAINLQKEHDYHLSHIGNMDETPVIFDLPSNQTAQRLLVKTTRHRKTYLTVMLTYLADDSKLKPLIIFKCKTLPKNGVLVKVHLKGWMDEEGTLMWLKKVWNTRPGGLCKCSVLVRDMFRAHVTDIMKNATKYRLRKMWTEWMCSGSAALTEGGNLKKPNISLICKWVKGVWESIPDEMICYSFLKCSISNAMDRSQDAAIYEEDG